jgi:hypothetical protein
MSNTMSPRTALKRAISGHKRFIEPIDEHGEYCPRSKTKGFNYFKYTQYCMQLSQETANGGSEGAYLLRDLAMTQIDKKFNPSKPYKFLGMDTLD